MNFDQRLDDMLLKALSAVSGFTPDSAKDDYPTLYGRRIVGQVVSLDDSFMSRVAPITRQIETYVRFCSSGGDPYTDQGRGKRPFNILLCAEPGSGKSFFVQEMYRHCKQQDLPAGQFVEINVSQVRSWDEVAARLAGVANKQSQEPSKSPPATLSVPFVFFDEVDAAGSWIFSNLLGPMNDGKFRHGQDIYKCAPAIWSFAASSAVTPEKFLEQGSEMKWPKLDDFWTRLKAKVQLNSIGKADDPCACADRLILAAICFSNLGIRSAPLDVLLYFAIRSPRSGAREIRDLIEERGRPFDAQLDLDKFLEIPLDTAGDDDVYRYLVPLIKKRLLERWPNLRDPLPILRLPLDKD